MIYIAILIIILCLFFFYQSRLRQADLRFQQEYTYARIFVDYAKVNQECYDAIKEQLSKILISGKPQLRLMVKLRNDFVKKFKKYVDMDRIRQTEEEYYNREKLFERKAI